MKIDRTLDRLDLRILTELQKRGRISNVELADAVGLSASPCLTRVKRLEKAGFIAGYGARVRIEKLGDFQVVLPKSRSQIIVSKTSYASSMPFVASTRSWSATTRRAATTICSSSLRATSATTIT